MIKLVDLYCKQCETVYEVPQGAVDSDDQYKCGNCEKLLEVKSNISNKSDRE